MRLTALPVAALFVSLTHGAALRSRSNGGQATFYGGNLQGGACMFSTYTLPSGIFGTALSDSNWDTAANCGACVQVTGPSGNTIMAMIVDECPGCGLNHLDLFPDAFSTLADPSKGVIPVSWSIVDCPITSALQLHNKEGVSRYWFSMQVVNANKPVSTLEVSTDGGATWSPTTRTSYNFFEQSSGFGTTVVDVKVTSADGEAVLVKNVEVSSGSSTTAPDNFGTGEEPQSSSVPTVPATTGASSSTSISSPPQATTSSTSVVAPAPASTSSTSCTSSTFIPPPIVSSTQGSTAPLQTTGSSSQSYNSSQSTAQAPAQTSASPLATSTVTVYSYAACTN